MRSIVAITIGLAVLVSAVTASASLARMAFGDGIYRVGKDIKAGTYRTRGGNECYWARLSGFSGSLDEIKANENAVGPAIVTILRTDTGFETDRCGNWTKNLGRIMSK